MKLRLALPLALLALACVPALRAQIQPVPGQPDDQANGQYSAQPPDQYAGPGGAPQQQPATGVARISLIQGNVSTQRGDTGDWTAATVNTPVVPGDRVSTGERSRVEVQLDFANIIRLDSGAVIRVTDLQPHHIQIELAQGLVSFDSFPASDSDVEIDTPNLAIHPQKDGTYRIEVNGNGETLVTVRRGQAEVGSTEGSTTLTPGQQITVRGDAATAQYKMSAAPARDGFDDWNDNRDRTIRSSLTSQNLSPYYTGGADLDQNGTWQNVPDYGNVWPPSNVPPDWAPYRDGAWIWEPGWGWTWVSYEPWGWAPYHYGRWFLWNSGWVWWPGPVYGYPGYYPLWAPAYVSFFGWGGGGWGFSFGFGFGWGGWGRIGWLPCGPGEWYHPWYGRWGGRFNAINVTNIHNTTIVNNFNQGIRPLAGAGMHPYSNMQGALSDARVRGGMSSMAGNEFGRGAVSMHQEAVSEASFRQASMMTGKMPVSPSRESYTPSGRFASASAVRNAPPTSQHFFSPASRGNSTAGAAGARSLAGTNEAGRGESAFGAGRSATAPVQSSRPGWRTFTPPQSGRSSVEGQGTGAVARSEANSSGRGTSPAASGQSSQTTGARTENGNGWQHFSGPSRATQSQGFVHSNTPSAAPQRAFNPPSSGWRGSYGNSTARPPLNMRQPIVTPRGGSYGYGAPRGGYSAPHGTYSAPHGYAGGGGGNRGGGGGGHSGGGGGRSGGGRSR